MNHYIKLYFFVILMVSITSHQIKQYHILKQPHRMGKGSIILKKSLWSFSRIVFVLIIYAIFPPLVVLLWTLTRSFFSLAHFYWLPNFFIIANFSNFKQVMCTTLVHNQITQNSQNSIHLIHCFLWDNCILNHDIWLYIERCYIATVS